jgi:hypothetical protein
MAFSARPMTFLMHHINTEYVTRASAAHGVITLPAEKS